MNEDGQAKPTQRGTYGLSSNQVKMLMIKDVENAELLPPPSL